MTWTEILSCLCIALTGAATAIPLIVKLVEYVEKTLREKNWVKLIGLVISLMESAEGMFESGAERKAWVMDSVSALAAELEHSLDREALSGLIDSMCGMSRVVNGPKNPA